MKKHALILFIILTVKVFAQTNNLAFDKSKSLLEEQLNNCENLQLEELKSAFLDYHVSIFSNKNVKDIDSDVLANLINTMSSCEAEKKSMQFKAIKDLNLKETNFIRKFLKRFYTTDLTLKLQSQNTLTFNHDNLELLSEVSLALKKYKTDAIAWRENKTKASFVARASKVNIAEAKTNKLLKAMEIRRQALKKIYAQKTSKKNYFSIIDTTAKAVEVEKRFHYAVISILNRKEYAKIIAPTVKPQVTRNALVEVNKVLKTYKLTKSQRKEFFNKVRFYYLTKAVNEQYYKYDKQTLKQKMGVAKLHFRKTYKELMQKYGFEVKNIKLDSDYNYSW